MNRSRALRPVLVVAALFVAASVGIGIYLFQAAGSVGTDQASKVITPDLSGTNVKQPNSDVHVVGGMLRVKGDLKVVDNLSTGAITITPTDMPGRSAGQLYVKSGTNGLYYFDGQKDVDISSITTLTDDVAALKALTAAQARAMAGQNQGVITLQGQTGNVTLGAGSGIGIIGTTITNTGVTSVAGQTGTIGLGLGLSAVGGNLVNSGVTGLGGQAGDIAVGSGLSVTGGILVNTGVNSILSGSATITVTDDGSGNFTISQAGSGTGGTVALGPVAAQLDSGNESSIWINKTGAGNLLQLSTGVSPVNRFVVDQTGAILTGTIAFNQVTGTPSFVNSIDGASGAILLGTGLSKSGQTLTNGGVLSIAGLTGVVNIGNGLVVNAGVLEAVNGGIQSISGTPNQVNVTGTQNVVLSLPQDISVTSTPTFAGINLGTPLTVGSGGTGSSSAAGARTNLGAAASGVNNDITQLNSLGSINRVGALSIQGTDTTLSESNGGLATTLAFASPTANVTYRLQTAAAGTYDVCTTVGNCVGVGGSVSTPGGTANTLAKFSSAGTIVDSSITDNGSVVSINGELRLNTFSTLAGGNVITVPNAAGTVAVSASGNIDLSATGNISFVGILPVASGGTGSGTASGARTNLGAAASGANSDISSLLGLTTALSVSQGGTGAGNLAQNGVLIGQGTGALTSVTAGGTGQCLMSTAGAPVFQTCPGSGGIASVTGTPNQVIVSGTNNITLSLPQDISVSSSPSFASLSLASALAVGSGGTGANNATSARSNLGAAASGINSDISQLTGLSNITSAGSLTIEATSNTLTLQGANTNLVASNGGFSSNLTFVAPTANVTYRLQTAAAGTYDVCTTAGNCVGVGGGVTTSGGTPNTLAKFTAAGSIGDSLITDNGTAVAVNGLLRTNSLSTLAGGGTITVPNASGTLAVSASGNIDLSATGNISFVGLLPVASGGTGSGTAAGARTNLGAAASGANSDITSLLGLTTALSVAQGGTGVANLTQNGVVIGQGTSGLMAVTAGAAGQCLVSTAGAPVFQACPGSAGVTSVSGTPNQVIVLGSGNLTLSLPQDIAVSSSPTFAGLTLSSALSIASGGTGSGTAAGARTNLGAAASGANADITSLGSLTSVNTASPLAISSTGNLTLQGANTTLIASDQGFASNLTFVAPTANVTYRLQTAAAGTYDVCTTAGNCTGVGGGVTSPGGTAGSLAKFSGSGTIVDSLISDNGSEVLVNGVLKMDVLSTLSGSNMIYVPNASGRLAISASGPITLDASGNLECPTCLTSGGGGGSAGVSSVNGLTGALTINSITGSSILTSGSTITIQDASSTVKGLASFNATNLTVSSGVVNTVQDIAVSSAPSFAGLAVTGTSALTLGSTGNAGGILFNDGSSAFRASLVAGSYSANQSIVVPNASGTLAVSASGNIALSPSGNISFAGVLPVANGGTGSSNVAGARTNLGAAASGANSDITSLLGLTTALSVAQGGTGTSSLTQNGVLIGQGTSGISSLVAGAAGQCLVSTAGAPTWQACPGSGGVSSVNGVTGAVTLTGVSVGSISTVGNTVTINDASTGTKGLASFTAANFTVTNGQVDTIQGISTTSSPLFNALTLTTALGVASGGTGVSGTPTAGQLLIGNGTGYSLSTLTAGTGINISNAAGAITISAPASGSCALCANQSLSNLASVAINTHLLPGVSSSVDVGSSAMTFRDGYFAGTLRAGVVDAATAGALAIGTTNATAINLNQDTVLAASKTLTITGGATGTRPVAPTEGMVYFDTTTKSLLTYANGRWQADRTTATKIVAANDSQNKDAADYVVSSADEAAGNADAQINAAITALPAGGGTVYLMEGTYTIDTTIALNTKTRLIGAGPGTIIKLKNGINANFDAITISSKHEVVIRDITVDGNKANNSSGNQDGIYAFASGSATQSGVSISYVTVTNFRNHGIDITNGKSHKVTNSSIFSNSVDGVYLNGATEVTISDNTISSNTQYGIQALGDSSLINDNTMRANGQGIWVQGASYLTISGNDIIGSTETNTGAGINLWSAGDHNLITSNNVSGGALYGIAVRTNSDHTTVTGNAISQNAAEGIFFTGSSDAVVSNNKLHDNGGTGSADSIEIAGAASSIAVMNNTITDTAGTGYAIRIAGTATNNALSGNVYSGTGATAILDSSTSTVWTNQMDDKGAVINKNVSALTIGTSTVNGTLSLQGGITSTALPAPSAPTIGRVGAAGSTTYSYAVTALDGTGETLASTNGTSATSNATLNGTNYNTITWTKVSGATSYRIYRTVSGGSPATTGLIGTVTTSGTGTTQVLNDTGLAASGSVPVSNTTGGATFASVIQGNSATLSGASSLTLGTSSSASGSIIFRNAANANTVTLSTAAQSGNYTLTIPTLGANDTLCLQSAGNCSGSGVNTIGAIDGGVYSANGASISGNTIYLQAASAVQVGLVNTGTQAFAGDKTFNGTLTVNDTVIAAGKSITITGGNTASRPASPTEGMVYFDTTTKQLLTYANGKWQGDRSTTTKTVAASNSSQAQKDAADYVADGTGDQAEINAALTAAAGGKVYLFEGTYTASATISIPNNTMLSGAGSGTLIQMADIDVDDNLIENSDASTGTNVTIRDLKINGRRDLNTLGTQNGIYLTGMGGGTGGTARSGALITNVEAINFRVGDAIHLQSSMYSKIVGNTVRNNGDDGIGLASSSNHNTISSNISQGNVSGLSLSSSNNNEVTGNSFEDNGTSVWVFGTSQYNTISSNTATNGVKGYYIITASNNTFSGNTAKNAIDGFYIDTGASSNNFTGNTAAGNSDHGFYVTGTKSTFTGNNIYGSGADGIITSSVSADNTFSSNTIANSVDDAIDHSGDNTTFTGNTITNNAGGITVKATASDNTITGNTIVSASFGGVYVYGSNNLISGNRIKDSGGLSNNNGIYLTAADYNTITNNTITDASATTTNYAINISDSTSDNNYISGNTLGSGATINDSGTGTIYANQINSSGALIQRAAGGFAVQNSAGASVLGVDVTGSGAVTVAGSGTIQGQTILGGSSNQSQVVIKANVSQTNANPLIVFQTSAGAEMARINVDANNNYSFGKVALQSLTSGTGNIAIGTNALSSNAVRNDNIAIGNNALQNATNTWSQVAIGANAMMLNQSGGSNTAVGFDSLRLNVSGSNNTALGINSLRAMTASESTGVGSGALQNATASRNTALGYIAGSATTSGGENTSVGAYAMNQNTTGNQNVVMGAQAMYVANGSQNVALGYRSMYQGASGTGNVASGYYALQNSTGNYNVGSGYEVLFNTSTGSGNVALGRSGLRSNTTGSNNSSLGYYAGYVDTNGSFATSAALQNATAIGAYAQVQADNSIVLGSVDTSTNVGIGTTKPDNLFSVSPVVYSTGNASQSGTTVTGSGTAWGTGAGAVKVGMKIIFAGGQSATITAVNSNTSLTVDTSQTVSSTSYRIHAVGFQVTTAGNAFVQNSSTTAFAVQNSSGTALFTADTTNMTVTVTRLVVTANLVVNGHIVSGGSTPTIAAGAAACTTPTVSVSGTDTSGTITVTTGTGCGATGKLATVTFSSAFGAAPRITMTPAGASGAALQAYVDSATTSTTTFDLGTATAPANSTTYKWYYHVIE